MNMTLTENKRLHMMRLSDENGIISRTRADAPEIDGVMYLHAPDGFRVRPGDLLRARVTDSDEYDLEGDIIIP